MFFALAPPGLRLVASERLPIHLAVGPPILGVLRFARLLVVFRRWILDVKLCVVQKIPHRRGISRRCVLQLLGRRHAHGNDHRVSPLLSVRARLRKVEYAVHDVIALRRCDFLTIDGFLNIVIELYQLLFSQPIEALPRLHVLNFHFIQRNAGGIDEVDYQLRRFLRALERQPFVLVPAREQLYSGQSGDVVLDRRWSSVVDIYSCYFNATILRAPLAKIVRADLLVILLKSLAMSTPFGVELNHDVVIVIDDVLVDGFHRQLVDHGRHRYASVVLTTERVVQPLNRFLRVQRSFKALWLSNLRLALRRDVVPPVLFQKRHERRALGVERARGIRRRTRVGHLDENQRIRWRRGVHVPICVRSCEQFCHVSELLRVVCAQLTVRDQQRQHHRGVAERSEQLALIRGLIIVLRSHRLVRSLMRRLGRLQRRPEIDRRPSLARHRARDRDERRPRRQQ